MSSKIGGHLESAGLPLTVKIGGCEAIRDLLKASKLECATS